MPRVSTRLAESIGIQRLEATLARIDDVLKANKREQLLYTILATVLFLTGISCLSVALWRNAFVWTLPPVFTTGLLHWPLKAIQGIRQKNIALAVAPAVITLLPAQEAVDELKKLLCTLYR